MFLAVSTVSITASYPIACAVHRPCANHARVTSSQSETGPIVSRHTTRVATVAS